MKAQIFFLYLYLYLFIYFKKKGQLPGRSFITANPRNWSTI